MYVPFYYREQAIFTLVGAGLEVSAHLPIFLHLLLYSGSLVEAAPLERLAQDCLV